MTLGNEEAKRHPQSSLKAKLPPTAFKASMAVLLPLSVLKLHGIRHPMLGWRSRKETCRSRDGRVRCAQL